MKRFALLPLFALASACAFPTQVKRFGMEYNTALSDMANEQTLLNIVRAKEGMPLHFTGVNRFTGNIALKASGGFNAQLRGEGLTSTNAGESSRTTAGEVAGGVTTKITTTDLAKTTLTSVIAEGVDQYTPSIGGELSSGTSFDIAIFDSQKFYQGILASIPATTVDNFIAQGWDDRTLMLLLIQRFDFRLKEEVVGFPRKKGVSLFSAVNKAGANEGFAQLAACYELTADDSQRKPVILSPLTRFTRTSDGSSVALKMEDMPLIDGEKLQFATVKAGANGKLEVDEERGLAADGSDDDKLVVARLSAKKRMPQLRKRKPACNLFTIVDNKPVSIDNFTVDPDKNDGLTVSTKNLPAQLPSDPRYDGEGEGMMDISLNGKIHRVPVTVDITYRSTEGVFRYLGDYLNFENRKTLFDVTGKAVKNPLVQTRLGRTVYAIDGDDKMSNRNMKVIALVQQLVNLQKESSDRPLTVPVRALP